MNKLLIAGCLTICSFQAQAEVFTVGAGEALEITFTMPAITNDTTAPTDTAYLSFGTPDSSSALHADATLFNGATALGSNTSNYGEIAGIPFYFYWTQSGSSFNNPHATIIDASSLIGRSIQGRFIVTFDGDFTVQQNSIYFGVGNGFNGTIATEGGNAPILTSISVIAVPEPEAYAMMLVGLGLVAFAVRSRTQPRTNLARME